MNYPLLSVIVPIYNSEKYLEACLLSIMNQTYQNIEIIMINDGSSDSSEKIVLDYMKKDQRIQYVFKTNAGVSSARNTGISMAKGDYITFVDSDDTLDLYMYQKMMDKILLQDADIVCCGYSKISLSGIKTDITGSDIDIEMSGKESIKHLFLGDLFTGSPCTKIYRYKLMEKNRFREDLKINEDVLFNYYLLKKAKRFIYLHETLYSYYERSGSATQITSFIKKQADVVCASKCIYKDSIREEYEKQARSKYIKDMMNYYRSLLYSKNDINTRKELSKEICSLLKMENEVGKKYIISFCGMRLCPWLYLWLYKYYDKVRKPNWDISVKKN